MLGEVCATLSTFPARIKSVSPVYPQVMRSEEPLVVSSITAVSSVYIRIQILAWKRRRLSALAVGLVREGSRNRGCMAWTP